MPTTWLSSKSHIITVVGKNVEKLEPSHTAGVNIKWYSYFGKVGQLLKRLKRELQHDPAIALLGIYINQNIWPHHNLYTEVHSTISCNSQKVETQMSIDWWVDKFNVLYPYNGILLGNKRDKCLLLHGITESKVGHLQLYCSNL